MARPLLELDTNLIEKLASIQCSKVEIASIMGCSVDTLDNRYSENVSKGREQGKMTLRRKMYESAMGGNAVMMIFLSKNYLGMSDKVETKVKDEGSDALTKENEQLQNELRRVYASGAV